MGESAESAALIVGYVLGLGGGVMMAFEAASDLTIWIGGGPLLAPAHSLL
jgi:hypothetical protein